ncbi:MAG TPA: TolC family protein [Spirochaetota bacterium]|nr:TolC family protein [Spirochaetota bacterium]HPF04455.1 TolC family protein [Spirochaetota bacterium]HPJ40773.1 TolC family protein [Spirochaetota bacterium]HPR36042.1 TolC family protein [Spirochaetota bacterium]HRX45956.1 TolC family protein [Spirochaetota bacterium]
MIRISKITIILILWFSCTVVYADERSVTIDECIEIALQNHPDFLLSIEDNKKSIADYKIARSVKSIIIDGEIKTVEYTRSDSSADSRFSIPGQDTDIGLFAGLSLTYNLYDSRKDIIEDQARTNIDIAKIKNFQVKNKIIFEVKNAYYGYLLSKNTLIIREEIYNKYKNKADLARQLFEQGSRPVLDVSKAEVDLADSKLQLEKAKNNERKMKLSLYYSMGLEETENLNINPVDVAVIPESLCSLNNLYRLSEVYSPVIRISKLEKKIARLKASEQMGAHYPTVDLLIGLGYENKRLYGMNNMQDNLDWSNWSPAFHGALRAAIPIYSGGKISARVDSALSDYNKIVYKEKEVLIDTKNQIRDNFKSLEEIKKQMEISELIIKNAQRHQLLAQRSYENGGGSLLELQDADLSVIKARIGYLESRYAYFITLAKLINIVGSGENSICKSRD